MKLKLTFILALTSILGLAQDPEFSMPNSSPLYLNPAMAGLEACPRISSNFRMQWPKIDGGFNTASISYDQYLHAIRGGVGLVYMYDWAGDPSLQTQSIHLVYAGHINIKEGIYIRPAINLGYRHRYIDASQLTFGDMIDERYDHIYDNQLGDLNDLKSNSFDLGAGLLAKYRNVIAAVSFNHINQPDEGFIGTSKLPMLIKAYAAYGKEFNPAWCFEPQITYAQQQDFQAITPIIGFTYKQTIKFGMGTRFNFSNADAVIMAAAVNCSNFTFKYSYDYTVNKLTNTNTGGSHEIGILYTFSCEKKNEYFAPPGFKAF